MGIVVFDHNAIAMERMISGLGFYDARLGALMATPFPPLPSSNPLIHHAALRFEKFYLQADGFDGEERQLKREYRRHGRRAGVRLLARSVLSGSWNMGETQTAVGDYLGLDHSCLSDALWKGEMSLDSFNAIIFSSDRPKPWPTPNVINHMNRSGFIAVARTLAAQVSDRKTLKADGLTELHYELMCECLGHSRTFGLAAVEKQVSDVGVTIVKKVCQDPDRHVIPVWCKEDEKKRIATEVDRLNENAEQAFQSLSDLFKNWFDIFAAATFCTEIGLRYGLDPTIE